MSTVVCVIALVTDRMPHLPTARVALIESAKPGRRVELPGGKALEEEPPHMAARREMREEIGIEVTNLEPLRTIQGEARPGAEFASDIWVFRARADAERAGLVAGDDAKCAFWASRGDVLELERNGCLSDLASKGVLLEWAREGGPVERAPAAIESAYYDLLATAVRAAHGLPKTATVGEMAAAVGRAQEGADNLDAAAARARAAVLPHAEREWHEIDEGSREAWRRAARAAREGMAPTAPIPEAHPAPPPGFAGSRGRVLGEAVDGAHVVRLVEYTFGDNSRVPYAELHETHDGARPGRVMSLSAAVHLAQNVGDREVWQIGNREGPPPEPVPLQEDVRAAAEELLRCAESWDPGARVMGNVTAEQVVSVARAVLSGHAAAPPTPPTGVMAETDATKAMAAEIASLRALVEAADTLAEAVCNLDDYSQDDPEGPELDASMTAYSDMRAAYRLTDARPEPTPATVERVTSEVLAAVSGPGDELVTRLAHGAEVREIVARGMGAGEPRCAECRNPIGPVAHVDCDAPTLGIVGRSGGYTPTPEPERTPEKDDAIKYEFTPRQIEILALIPDEQIETHLARRRARRSGGAQ